MPSKAYRISQSYSCREVSSIIDIFEERNSRRGRNTDYGLLHGALMLLVSAWEVYCEEMSREAVGKLVGSNKVSFELLPESLRRRIIRHAYAGSASNQDPLVMKIAMLPGSGWKALLSEMLNDYLHDFNTPKFTRGKGKNLRELFGFFLGVNVSEELDAVTGGSNSAGVIDWLVTVRSAIAHQGMPDERDRFTARDMRGYMKSVLKVCAALESMVHKEFRETYALTPWKITKNIACELP